MSKQQAFQAVTRFGLGASPGELASVGADARAWLEAQLDGFAETKGPPRSDQGIKLAIGLVGKQGEERMAAQKRLGNFYRAQTFDRLEWLRDARLPFVERLVLFWSNHFTVALQKGQGMHGLVHDFQDRAIRAHVLGRFEDMLIAVLRHPAMLIYLDNEESFGTNVTNIVDRKRGINENLARETLELYSLGVDGGYTQADVIALAKILTGWTLGLHRYFRRPIPRYRFEPSLHERGKKILLGRTFSQGGEREGIAALRMLARHPPTARFLAHKLAVHFVADQPPDSLVQQLAEVYLDTEGQLSEVYRALLRQPGAWSSRLSKLKTPQDYVISTARLLRLEQGAMLFRIARELGQEPFRSSSPQGYPDRAADWSSPDAMLERVSWAHQLGRRFGKDLDPRALMHEAVGPVVGADTRFAIENAPSRQVGLALLLASPEFQRR